MNNYFKKVKNIILSRYYYCMELIFPSSIIEGKEIPIIINNFNRLSSLDNLIKALEKRGYQNIYIIDNKSTYPPLLEYYNTCPYKIFMLEKNLGFKALWKSGLSKKICNDYYIYTDSDVIPIDECPNDFIDYMFKLLNKYKYARKIGLSLRIDNLPDHYKLKHKVIEWESKFYKIKNDDGLYLAPIDTTFALYRPRVGLSRSRFVEAYRTDFPYQAEHIPWYTDSLNPSDEEVYYVSHCAQPTAWSKKLKD